MIIVRGYKNGRRIVEDIGPGEGRVQGHGGEALGSRYVLTVVKQAQHRNGVGRIRYHTPPPEPVKPICGAWMPLAATSCARRPGHHDTHRTAEALEHERITRQAKR